MQIIKISDLEMGKIIWDGDNILGVTGLTLPKDYYDYDCIPIPGNSVDYQIIRK